jgi:hypothetical protein
MQTFITITEAIPLLGLFISIGALWVAYLSYRNTNAATRAAERSATAAERSADASTRATLASERSAEIAERSALAAERSAETSERGVRAAERSLRTTRPFLKLSNPIVRVGKDNTIEISVEVLNFGTLPAKVTHARVNTTNYYGRKLGLSFDVHSQLIYPGESETFSVIADRTFTPLFSDEVIDYVDDDPSDFVFKFDYCAKDDEEEEFREAISFRSLRWS